MSLDARTHRYTVSDTAPFVRHPAFEPQAQEPAVPGFPAVDDLPPDLADPAELPPPPN